MCFSDSIGYAACRLRTIGCSAHIGLVKLQPPKLPAELSVAIPASRLTLEWRVETLSLGRIIQPHWCGWVCQERSLDSPFLFCRLNPPRPYPAACSQLRPAPLARIVVGWHG